MFKKSGGCPHCGDRKFNNVKFADSANKKFPIDTPENIKQSWASLHEGKNANKFKMTDLKTMEQKIIDAWTRHIGKDIPNPTDFKE